MSFAQWRNAYRMPREIRGRKSVNRKVGREQEKKKKKERNNWLSPPRIGRSCREFLLLLNIPVHHHITVGQFFFVFCTFSFVCICLVFCSLFLDRHVARQRGARFQQNRGCSQEHRNGVHHSGDRRSRPPAIVRLSRSRAIVSVTRCRPKLARSIIWHRPCCPNISLDDARGRSFPSAPLRLTGHYSMFGRAKANREDSHRGPGSCARTFSIENSRARRARAICGEAAEVGCRWFHRSSDGAHVAERGDWHDAPFGRRAQRSYAIMECRAVSAAVFVGGRARRRKGGGEMGDVIDRVTRDARDHCVWVRRVSARAPPAFGLIQASL